MPRRKKFDKKQAERFVLVHRSRDDPSYGVQGASDMVLLNTKDHTALGMDEHGDDTLVDERALEKVAQGRVHGRAVAEVDEFGYPVDGYNYQQHLATIGGGTFVSRTGEILKLPTPGAGREAESDGELTDTESVCSVPDADLDGEMLPSITMGGQRMPAELREALELLEAVDAGGDEAPPVAVEEEGAGGAAASIPRRRRKYRPKRMVVAGFEMLNDDFALQAAGEKAADDWEVSDAATGAGEGFGLAGDSMPAAQLSAAEGRGAVLMGDDAAAAFMARHEEAMATAAGVGEGGGAELAGLDAHVAALLQAAGEEEEDIEEVFASMDAAAAPPAPKYISLSASGFDIDAHAARLIAQSQGVFEDLDAEEEAVEEEAVPAKGASRASPAVDVAAAASGAKGGGRPAVSAAPMGYTETAFFKQFVSQYDDELLGYGPEDEDDDWAPEEEEGDEEDAFLSIEQLAAKYGMDMAEEEEEEEEEEYSVGPSRQRAPEVGDVVPGYGKLLQPSMNSTTMSGAQALLEAAMVDYNNQRVPMEELFAGAFTGHVLPPSELAEGVEEEDVVTALPGARLVPYGWGQGDAEKSDEQHEEELAGLLKRKERSKWDVETVLSTYSTLDNHTRKLGGRSSDSVVSGSRRRRGPGSVASSATATGPATTLLQGTSRARGADVGAVGEEGGARPPPAPSAAFSIKLPAFEPMAGGGGAVGDSASSHSDGEGEDSDGGDSVGYAGTLMSSTVSRRGESAEDRKMRKAAVRAVRRARRANKAAMKAAFKQQEAVLKAARTSAAKGAASAAGHSVFRIA